MFATIRGHEAWYEQSGDHGPRVLLLMGFGMSGVAWKPVAEHLAADHQVVIFDPRGIGQSTPGEGPHGIPHLADDAADLLDHLGWQDAHLVGVSMGGMVAQNLALRHRGMARSMTLIASHGGPFKEMMPGRRGIQLFVQANTQGKEGRLEALTQLLFPASHLAERAGAGLSPHDLASVAKPASRQVRAAHFASITQHHTRPMLHALHDLPTLIMRPDLDILVPPRGSDTLHAAMPHARMISYPTAGHGLISQLPERVARDLAEHVAGVERAHT